MSANLLDSKASGISTVRKYIMGKELHSSIMKALPFHDHRSSPITCRYYAADSPGAQAWGRYRCSIVCVARSKKYLEVAVDSSFETAWRTCIDLMVDKLLRGVRHLPKGKLSTHAQRSKDLSLAVRGLHSPHGCIIDQEKFSARLKRKLLRQYKFLEKNRDIIASELYGKEYEGFFQGALGLPVSGRHDYLAASGSSS